MADISRWLSSDRFSLPLFPGKQNFKSIVFIDVLPLRIFKLKLLKLKGLVSAGWKSDQNWSSSMGKVQSVKASSEKILQAICCIGLEDCNLQSAEPVTHVLHHKRTDFLWFFLNFPQNRCFNKNQLGCATKLVVPPENESSLIILALKQAEQPRTKFERLLAKFRFLISIMIQSILST